MSDEYITKLRYKPYLVTYEWRSLGPHSSAEWKRENAVIRGCPALWWAKQLEWYRKHEEAGREKNLEYAAQGKPIPLSEVVYPTEMYFLYATPITGEGYDALDGVVG
jgi:hypothetical protein